MIFYQILPTDYERKCIAVSLENLYAYIGFKGLRTLSISEMKL